MNPISFGRTLQLIVALVLCHSARTQLVVKEFTVKEGIIKIFLPPMVAGATISGTVKTYPSGKTDKERGRNEEALRNYRITAGQTTFTPGEGRFSLQPSAGAGLDLRLISGRGQILQSTTLPLANAGRPPGTFRIPPFFTAGEPGIIYGPFDGNLSNTSVRIGGTATEILAESQGQTYFSAPAGQTGQVQVSCTENEATTAGKSHALQLDLSADKLNLLKGESTTLHVKVSGLEGLEETVPLYLQNLSPNTVTLEGGNSQQISIHPSQTGAAGIYSTSLGVLSIESGNFSISAHIESPNGNETGNAAILCNCFLRDRSYLMSPQYCLALGGRCDAATMNGIPGDANTGTTASTPGVSVDVPAGMDTTTGRIRLRLATQGDRVSAVLFSHKPVGGDDWYRAGQANRQGNDWVSEWTAPLGSDGLHTVRVRIADKDNRVIERFTHTVLNLTPAALTPLRNENFSLSISEEMVQDADRKAGQLARQLAEQQQKINELEKKQQELENQAEEKLEMAGELATIDGNLDRIPGVFGDSLKKLSDSLKNLQGGAPSPPDPESLQQNADDAAQRLKDCQDRLEKLRQEKADLEKHRDDLKSQQDALLNQMDRLHRGNGWTGGHGYHPDGRYWFGYVGDENSNTGIDAQSGAIKNQLRSLNKAYRDALNRLKNIEGEIADAEKECEDLKKESDLANQALANNNSAQAVSGQVNELNRQIQDLLDDLRDWCAEHPGQCSFEDELEALGEMDLSAPGAVDAFLEKLNEIIARKQQMETDLENGAAEDAAAAEEAGESLDAEKENANGTAGDLADQQAEAERLRAEREAQLEAERAAQRKKDEEEQTKKTIPQPQPTLPVTVNPSDDQLKFQAQRLFRELYRDYLVGRGPCDCITKAIALANNTNTVVTDIIGGIGVGVAFAPLEALPGLSFGAKLGLGAAKALAGTLFAGQNFSDELVKNMFNVIGGELFPKLTGDDFTGSRLNELASGGLGALMEAEGVRSTSWEGETELRGCGKVKGKTVILFNPNTGWVVIMIKIDNCPPVVIKYRVNKDGVPVTKPIVKKLSG